MKDEFNKYKIRITPEIAIKLSNLISEHTDFDNLTVGEVLDLNMLVVQLEDILNNEQKILEAKIIEVSL